MRARVFIAAAFTLGCSLAACSGSTPELRPAKPVPSDGDRDIRLAEPPPAAEPVSVSDLEAGRTLRRPQAQSPLQRSGTGLGPAPEPTPEPHLVPATLATELIAPPSASATAPAVAGEAEDAPQIERASAMPAWTPGEGGATGEPQPWGSPRGGPVIIIRGGRGGPDDHCDLGRPGIRGRIPRPGGIAINRSTPGPSGGMRARGGIR